MPETLKNKQNRSDRIKQTLAIGALGVAIFGPVVYGSMGHIPEERQTHSQEALGIMGEEALFAAGGVATVKMRRTLALHQERVKQKSKDPYGHL